MKTHRPLCLCPASVWDDRMTVALTSSNGAPFKPNNLQVGLFSKERESKFKYFRDSFDGQIWPIKRQWSSKLWNWLFVRSVEDFWKLWCFLDGSLQRSWRRAGPVLRCFVEIWAWVQWPSSQQVSFQETNLSIKYTNKGLIILCLDRVIEISKYT